MREKLNENENCDVLYSDEDKLDMDGDELFDPHFKPDFNPDLLTSVNYICHLFVVKKELLDTVGGFRAEYDGAQDYDFIFRCTENAKQICISARCMLLTGAATQIPRQATPRASFMPSQPVPVPLWTL